MPAQTALLENMPAAVRGRVFGVLASIASAASLVPILIAGPLADAMMGPTVIAITASGVVITATWSGDAVRAAAEERPGRRRAANLRLAE